MSYQVLARKWRPQTLQAMVGQEHIVQMLTNALTNQRLHHAYLFTGTRGVGKTTLARILAKCLNCDQGITPTPCGTCHACTAIDTGRFLDLLEIDAASRTKVEDTRELLDNVHYQPTQGRYKIYLIDEVHMLSQHSFNALLKTVEEPPTYVKFLLATTDPKRLPITILSRCLQLNLKCIETEKIAHHLTHICQTESLHFEMPALQLLAEAALGSLRDALSLLDQAIVYGGDAITLSATQQMLGSIEQDSLIRLLNALSQQNGTDLLAEVAHLASYAVDFNQALESILSIFHQVSIIQVVTDIDNKDPALQKLAQDFSAEEVQLYYQIALNGRRDLPYAANPQQGFEMIMLRMLAFKPVGIEDPTPVKKTQKETPPAPPRALPEQKQPLVTSAPIEKPLTTRSWTEILAKLELTGMAYALAANCTVQTMTAEKIILSLSIQHEPMLNKKQSTRIEEALTRFFNHPMQLEIRTITHDNEMETPTKQHEKENNLRQNKAADAIQQDGDVRKIMELFNATLDIDSIKAV